MKNFMFKSLNKAISTPIAIIIVIVVGVLVIGGVLAYQYWWAPEEGAEVETPSEPLSQPNPQVAVITSVNPTLVHVGSDIIIKGSKFSDNRNVISLTPKDTSLLPAYNINAHKITSTSNGTEITIAITPENFRYGDCRSPGGMCQSELGKIPDGVYYLSILNSICTGYNCESNKISLTIVNQ